ncbi:intradiol ring-cleavage dioxygenase [Actinoplanes oblitus]|uniref:Intradiol ring-cleavage dioxygenase n=1 Tax=Actinoplanes oblitus TaxID=3040509 RepID=A0ABY8WCU9_9ACTN|nr:intradiol ring-cleavage dioxygenase [Actinoplanes oblitus]WIM94229.1 intradiol ring-cleavage dioxygenase [Actinoplanes oblitus]
MQDNDAYVREVHDKGLRFDLPTMSRRRMLGVAGGVGAAVIGGALTNAGTADAATTGTAGATTGAAGAVAGAAGATSTDDAAACLAEVESETAGPYPADGSNGPDVRKLSGIVRSDIRSSFGTSTTTAPGVPLQFSLTVRNLGCAPVAGAAIYAWHCDRAGRYSLYSSGVTGENYLRGIQVTNSSGVATFTSIYPGCYAGRWPHIHFEVYSSLAAATSGAGPIRKTSQIALPKDVSQTVYASATGYSASVTNLSRISLATDMVFRDDLAAREMATVTGSVAAGYVANLTISVNL